ncbi:putative NUDIX family NTP pyrophosphohydrolase [Microbacterium testaceum]|uniref:NUDIX domain-containing protein n=1 Tax=Microbacterium TaxID=33882 RepID=UPI001AE9E14E|nr:MULTISPECIES: NUDIX domain-containing protein [Microbacterium]MDQ1112158.1 putative NUDIX family NTP pyrophosphohydrolase [Microbacterium testaceum]MDR6097307.1 putative NUDIX family NTP pyrophosphohydrolase [Microbacterium sp. SORGH_AS_0454]
MVVWSAGLLLYRLAPEPQVFVAHMGGPFWAKKDAGAWSIPKGEYDPDTEGALDAARREFREELGVDAPEVEWAELGTFAYSSGKKVVVFAGDGSGFSASDFAFGTFEMAWPPRSGKTATFPEVDRAEWMGLDAAREALVKGQRPAIDALAVALEGLGGD